MVTNICWKKVGLLPHKYFLVNKVRGLRMIHKYYPANHYLKKLNKYISINCTFCVEHPETVSHLFSHFLHVKQLWKDIHSFIIVNILDDFCFLWENVLLSFLNCNKDKEKQLYLINLIVLMAKCNIHKC